jgi:hypothetical protein
MAALWRTPVVDRYVEDVFESLRTTYSGSATLCQDLTVFNVTPAAAIARQATVDWTKQAVVGKSATARSCADRRPSPPWFTDAYIDWQPKLG